MIIHGTEQLPIGECVDVRILAPDGRRYVQPALIVRRASRKDYLRWCDEHNYKVYVDRPIGPLFYEIATD